MAKPDYYVQKTKHIEPLNIESNDQVLVNIDVAGLHNIVTTQLYKNPFSGFRELYANAVRACKEAHEKYGATPLIDIVIDAINMEFSMIEHDSTGITDKTFKEVLTVLGRSSNFDGTSPGQFGIGFASYYAISDNIFLESLSRDEGKISYLIREMKVCENLIKTNPVSLETYGTKIKFKMQKLKPNKNIKKGKSNYHLLADVVAFLRYIAQFSGILTNLTIINAQEDWGGFIGTSNIGPLKPKDIMNINIHHKEEILEISNDDYDMTAFGYHGDNARRLKTKYWACLAGIPIRIDNLGLNGFNYVYLSIKNERDYPPVTSRDDMTDEATDKLSRKIKKDLHEGLYKYSYIDNVKKWMNLSQGLRDYVKIIFYMEKKNSINDEKLDNLKEICRITNTNHDTYIHGDERSKPYALNELLELTERKEIRCINEFNLAKIKTLFKYHVMVVPKMKDFKIVSEYIKDASNVKEKKLVKMYPCHKYSNSADGTMIFEKDADKHSDIRVPSNADAIAAKLRKFNKNSSIRIFNGTMGGISSKTIIKNAFKSDYGNVKGEDIFVINDETGVNIVLDPNEEMIKTINNYKQYVPMTIIQYRKFHIACVLAGKKCPNAFYATLMPEYIGRRYGSVDFRECFCLDKIIESLESIHDKEMQENLAKFYQEVCRSIHAKHDVEANINYINDNIGEALKEKTTYGKLLYLAFNMKSGNYTDQAWWNVLKMIRKTPKVISSICDTLNIDYHSSYNYLNRRLEYDVKGDCIIGDSKMKRLQDIGVIKEIDSVKATLKDENVFIKACLII